MKISFFCDFTYFNEIKKDKLIIKINKIFSSPSPNLIDFLLCVLNYSDNCMIFFIFRFINQAIYIYFCLALYGCIFYKVKAAENCLEPCFHTA